MWRFLCRLTVCITIAAFLTGCSNLVETGKRDAEDLTDNQNNPVQAPNSTEELENYAEFVVDIDNGAVAVTAFYNKTEHLGQVFLLNRDFTVNKLVCDGEEIEPDTVKELINFDEEYWVNEYRMPKFEKSLYIEYTGFLNGLSSSTRYAKETISKEFTLFRSETYCYPIFADNWQSYLAFLFEPVNARISINVPSGQVAATPFPLISTSSDGGRDVYIFDGDMASFDCAISEFNILSLPSGDYYLLPEMDLDEMTSLITPIMSETQRYLNEHFGEADISADMSYIVIPDTFGSYVSISGKGVFIQDSSFTSLSGMRQLIHEFIHLGWNPEPEFGEVQRTRFFDEAFTCYFEYRVFGHMTDEETYLQKVAESKEWIKSVVSSDESYLVPVVDYGKYEYGDLCYHFGPVFFDEFSNLVGRDSFDMATKQFLKKYKGMPVNFEKMCEEYIDLLEMPELDEFFKNWLYTTNAMEQLLSQ